MPFWVKTLRRLSRDESAEDLIEYAFLTLFVALASAGVLLVLEGVIGAAFGSSSTAIDALWEPPEPG
jgi:Flp pilus assembly pilin Flp